MTGDACSWKLLCIVAIWACNMKVNTLKKPASNQKGFSLIEVLIAMTILSIGILGTTQLQISFMQSNAKARIMTVGTAKAQEMIEELASLRYNAAVFVDDDGDGTGQDANNDGVDDDGGNFGLDHTGPVGSTDAADQIVLPNPAEPNDRYTFYWNVAVNHPAAGLKTINVIVQWPDEKNITREVEYTFIKANM